MAKVGECCVCLWSIVFCFCVALHDVGHALYCVVSCCYYCDVTLLQRLIVLIIGFL